MSLPRFRLSRSTSISSSSGETRSSSLPLDSPPLPGTLTSAFNEDQSAEESFFDWRRSARAHANTTI
ncbi:unnamed protein product, partial [Mesorhabditis belari]|uniref:Uncharacterized protein n=1 Tax=Mesorhabditis belari TaxID=2138241 RepID=A0AAF3F3D5_9BILA